jgi:hypothetical protein
MRPRLALIITMLAMAATPALAASPTTPVKLTIPGTGISCVLTTASAQCQGSSSAATFSATVTPSGQVTSCNQPQGASPGCVLWPGARYKNVFLAQPEPTVGPFACVPIGLWMKATGAVCTVTSSGKGFRITAGRVVPVNVNGPGPYPPCTRAALTASLTRGLHLRTLAPSFLTRGWVCAGNYARGDYIDVHGRIRDDIVVLFRAKGRGWQLISRGGATCVNGKLPAPVYIACTVD